MSENVIKASGNVLLTSLWAGRFYFTISANERRIYMYEEFEVTQEMILETLEDSAFD